MVGVVVDDPASEAEPRPVPMLLSAACGAIGVVFLLLGALLSSNPLFFAGLIAGTLSLAFALYWRSELITAWREGQGRPQR